MLRAGSFTLTLMLTKKFVDCEQLPTRVKRRLFVLQHGTRLQSVSMQGMNHRTPIVET